MWTSFNATVIKEENGFYLVRLSNGTELTAKRSDQYQEVEIGKTMVCRSRHGFNYITHESVVNFKYLGVAPKEQ